MRSILRPTAGADLHPSQRRTLTTASASAQESAAETIARYTFRRKATRRRHLDAQRVENCAAQIRTLPDAGETLHFVTDGRFEPIHIVPTIRQLSHPASIARLTMTTLGFNEDNVALICAGIDERKIGRVTIVVSGYFDRLNPGKMEYARAELGARGARIEARFNHTKIIICEMSNGKDYVVEGSGNLRSCGSLEQFALTHDRDLARFHLKWIDHLITNPAKYT